MQSTMHDSMIHQLTGCPERCWHACASISGPELRIIMSAPGGGGTASWGLITRNGPAQQICSEPYTHFELADLTKVARCILHVQFCPKTWFAAANCICQPKQCKSKRCTETSHPYLAPPPPQQSRSHGCKCHKETCRQVSQLLKSAACQKLQKKVIMGHKDKLGRLHIADLQLHMHGQRNFCRGIVLAVCRLCVQQDLSCLTICTTT